MENFIKVYIGANGRICLTPNDPFSKANLTEEQACELISAIQAALDHLHKTPFVRQVSIHNWNAA